MSGHVTLSANFLQDVAACFSKERTLTTLSKRSLKCLALEGDLQEVLKTHIKTSWKGIREWKGDHCNHCGSIPIPTTTGLHKPLNGNTPYSLAPMLDWQSQSYQWITTAQGPFNYKQLMDVLQCTVADSSFTLLSTPLSLSCFHPSFHPFFTSSFLLYLVCWVLWIRSEDYPPPAALRMSR